MENGSEKKELKCRNIDGERMKTAKTVK